MGLCAEDDNKVVQIAIVQLIFRTRVVLLVVLVLVSGNRLWPSLGQCVGPSVWGLCSLVAPPTWRTRGYQCAAGGGQGLISCSPHEAYRCRLWPTSSAGCFFASLQPKITLIWSLLRWLSGVTWSSRWRSLVSPLFLCDQTTLLLPPHWSLLFATFKKCQHSGASQEVMSQKRLHVRCFIIVESQQKHKHCDCSFNKKAPTTAGCRAMLLPADPPQAAYTKAFWEYFLFPVLPFSRQQNILSFRK